MTSWSATQYRTMLDTHRAMVEAGWHPAVAGQLVRRAAGRVMASGMGKVHETRRIERELYPSLPPRPAAGGGCRFIQEIPGQEEKLYEEVNRLQSEGWNVSEVAPSAGEPSLRSFYACPPGQLPGQSQSQFFTATPWGGPLYVSDLGGG